MTLYLGCCNLTPAQNRQRLIMTFMQAIGRFGLSVRADEMHRPVSRVDTDEDAVSHIRQDPCKRTQPVARGWVMHKGSTSEKGISQIREL